MMNDRYNSNLYIGKYIWIGEVNGMTESYNRNSFERENNIHYNTDGYYVYEKKQTF